ncbi:hypothetical protein [Vitiosangium sp. GDMCC 1.1324]|uniref:hypothetical protein n=1 Tax=Vitiosangium sp. (strain GDMCC 1.1324) TaxID=2138576 RepID=UPI000D3ACF22|nr:hypothetical protein [Vitiosangium sp. GDMCC 1.1324]PTL78932.1 hypothetical protein DAT35_35480 [Vitiosangium sp. GDMCC 1.1324]
MNMRLIGLGTGVVLASVLGACNAAQQDPQCVVAKAVSDGSTGSFAATYSLKEGQDPSLSCARLKPEPVGLEKYFSKDENGPESVVIRSSRLGKLLTDEDVQVDPDAPNQANSPGVLTTAAPGPDNFCEVPTLAPSRLVVRSTAGGSGPGMDLTYAWSNLRIYNTPDIPGTQFVADLRYTENGCTAEYKVRGIWPVVSCATKGKPDESKCDPYADPPVRLRGSGINPSFPVKCDPDALICVLTGEVPSVP